MRSTWKAPTTTLSATRGDSPEEEDGDEPEEEDEDDQVGVTILDEEDAQSVCAHIPSRRG